MTEIRIRGAEEFAALSRRLKQGGHKDLRKELFKGINSAAKPARAAVKKAMPDHMPDRYARELKADFSLLTRKRPSRNPGISLRGKTRKKRRKVVALNDGTLSHPLFGNRNHWYKQSRSVKKGFFNEPLEEQGPKVQQDILAAMERVANKIAHGGP